MITFEQFAEKRRLLQDFCSLHYPSVEHFYRGLSFAINDDEQITANSVRHLTSTATCYSSLFACPSRFKPSGSQAVEGVASRYADKAIELPAHRWKSDGSAHVYCRCRALPFVIRNLPRWHESIVGHIRIILRQMADDPERFAIGEADPGEPKEKWYRPNAYHTFWTLRVLEELENAFPKQFEKL